MSGKKSSEAPEQLTFIKQMDARRAQLEMTGGWYQVKGEILAAHFFMCAREDSEFAVSSCGAKVVNIEHLHHFEEAQKCITCASYSMFLGGEHAHDAYKRRKAHAAKVEQLKLNRQAKSKPRSNQLPLGEMNND